MNNPSTQPPKLLIGLAGAASVGKDTVAELIHDMNQSCFVIVDVRTQPEVDAIHAQGDKKKAIESVAQAIHLTVETVRECVEGVVA